MKNNTPRTEANRWCCLTGVLELNINLVRHRPKSGYSPLISFNGNMFESFIIFDFKAPRQNVLLWLDSNIGNGIYTNLGLDGSLAVYEGYNLVGYFYPQERKYSKDKSSRSIFRMWKESEQFNLIKKI